jgi:nucleotide-binding universal stress UspA family protein
VTRFERTTVAWCDGSPASLGAVAAATREASRRGTGLVLLVAPGRAASYGAATSAEDSAEATSPLVAAPLDLPAVEERAVALASAADATVPLEVVVAVDAPQAWLLDLAQRTDLVVMRGHGRLGRPMLWAAAAAGQAPDVTFDCPVLVVDGQDVTGPETVLAHEPAVVAGLDMVRGSEPVLLTAAAEAVSRSVGLTLVHALGRDATLEPATLADGWRRCRAALHAAHLPRGVPNRLVVSQEDPVVALLNRVGPRDLLVVGAGGDRPAGGDPPAGGHAQPAGGHEQPVDLARGPVSRGVLEAMPCDVLVVPPWPHRPTLLDIGSGRLDGLRQPPGLLR